MAERRLTLFGANLAEITHDTNMRHQVGHMDLSDMPNADARTPLLIVVQEKCSMGAWHDVGRAELPFWDDDHWRTQGKQDKPGA